MNSLGRYDNTKAIENARYDEESNKETKEIKNQSSHPDLDYLVASALEHDTSVTWFREILKKPNTRSAGFRGACVAVAAKDNRYDLVDLFLSDGECAAEHLNRAIKKSAEKGHIRPVISLLLTNIISKEAMKIAAQKAVKHSDGMIVALLNNAISKVEKSDQDKQVESIDAPAPSCEPKQD